MVGKKALANSNTLRIKLPRPLAVIISFLVVIVLMVGLVVIIFFSS